MTVKSIIGSGSDKEKIPEVIKDKLENFKTESRLINNKQIKIGKHIVVIPKGVGVKKSFKLSVEIINYESLSVEPIIPKFGHLLTDIYRFNLINNKNEIVSKSDLDITYKIQCENLDNYCYPIILQSDQWNLLKSFEIENDYIKTNANDFDMITIIRENPYDIINITQTGGLLYTKLDPLISLRIPKGNFKQELKCKIQISEMQLENLNQFKQIYENEISFYLNISKMFTLEFSDNDTNKSNEINNFRRPISIKLPLPEWIISILNEQQNDSKTVIKDQKKEKLGFYFLQKSNNEWNFVDSNLRFTSNSIEFDIKRFGSFIFVKCRENREMKLCQNMNFVEDLIQIQTGVVLTFLWIKTNNWFLLLEIVPISRIKETRSRLESVGFIYVEQYFELLKIDESKNNSKFKRKLSKVDLIERKTFELIENLQFKIKLSGEIEQSYIFDKKANNTTNNNDKVNEMIDQNSTNELTKFDEFDIIGAKKKNKVQENETQVNLKSHFDISFNRNLRNSNFIVISIKPIKRNISEWESIVLNKLENQSIYEDTKKSEFKAEIPVLEPNYIQTDIDLNLIAPISQESHQLTRLNDEEKAFHFYSELQLQPVNMHSNIIIPTQTFKFYIPVEKMKLYHQIKTKNEIRTEQHEVETIKIQQQEEEHKQIEKPKIYHQPIQIIEKPKQINYNRISGLARPRFSSKMIEKEPKIISRRSFLALSSVIRQGLKLAVYLSIPDNAIAGIGFDALSQMSMNGTNNTTYKILLLWKKMILYNKIKESDYVDQLITGLKSIGYENIGELVYDKWMKQQDITVDDCQRCLLQTIF